MHILHTPTLGLHLPLQEETDFLHAKKSPFGAGEVAQGMKRLDVLAEDPGSVPVPTYWLTTIGNSSSKRSTLF